MGDLVRQIRGQLSITQVASDGGIQVKRQGRRIFILCPWHNENTPSAELYPDQNRGFCHSCRKRFDSIDLWAHFNNCSVNEAIRRLKSQLGLDENQQSRPQSKVVATYDYIQADDKLSYQVLRKEPKAFIQRRPDAKGGWIYNLDGIEPVPFRLPELLAASAKGESIFVAEGEKDVLSLVGIGLTATCNSGGAGKWTEAHSKYIPAGAKVVILPDNDEPGRKHAESIASQLVTRGCLVKIIELPRLSLKGDVSEWLQAGHSKEELLQLVERATYMSHETVNDWPEIMPLCGAAVPPFPVDALPGWMANFVSEISETTQTPPDLSAMLSLTAVAAAVAKKVVIVPREGWREPLNIYSVTALPPASRKSAVFAEITSPIIDYEHSLIEQQKAAILAARANYRMIEAALEKAKDNTAKQKAAGKMVDTNIMKRLAEELASTENPSLPRILADDLTLEQAGIMLADHDGRLAIMSAEGDIFDILAGRYSSGGINLGVILKGHSGDSLRVDRVGRAPVSVDNPALTIGLAIQPDVLRGLCQKPGFRGRGLLGRFMYSLPDSNIGQRKIITRPVSEATKQAYFRNLTRLLDLPVTKSAAVLTLAPDAKSLFEDFEDQIEHSLGIGGSLSAIPDWGGKLCGAVARIAGLIHMASVGFTYQEVKADTVHRAITISEYLEAHALAAFGLMGGDEGAEAANRILRTIDRQQWETFSQRDVYQTLKGSIKTVDELIPSLNLLVERGYVRRQEGAQKTGRPSVIYEINPKYAPQYPQYPQKSGEQEGFGDFGDFEDGISSRNCVDEACRVFGGVIVEGGQYGQAS